MTSRFLRPARNETEETAALFRGFCDAAGQKKDAVSVNNRINQRFLSARRAILAGKIREGCKFLSYRALDAACCLTKAVYLKYNTYSEMGFCAFSSPGGAARLFGRREGHDFCPIFDDEANTPVRATHGFDALSIPDGVCG